MKWWDDDTQATLIAYVAIALPALVVVAVLRPRPLLPMQRLRFGSWTGPSVLFHFMLWLMAMVVAQAVFERLTIDERFLPPVELPAEFAKDPLKGEERLKMVRLGNLSQPLGALLFLAMSFSLLPVLQRTPVWNAGMNLARWLQSIVLGVRVFLVATPAVFAIQIFAVHVWEPEHHAFEIFGSVKGLGVIEWAMLLLNVVVFGPICEEWVFRGLLQGWLRRSSYRDHALFVCFVAATVGLFVVLRKLADTPVPMWLVAWTAILAAVDMAGVYILYRPIHDHGLSVFRRDGLPPLDEADRLVDAWTVNLFSAEGQEHLDRPWREFGSRWFTWKAACARWSIVASSMFFALVHSPWPTPIALFFLGLVLGWLAYRTQSLVAPIVVHGLFNLVSYVALVMLSLKA